MTNSRLRYLDGLKAIAIIVVVMFHAGILEYGYLGVDVFLVLSGFLVTRSFGEKKYFHFIVGRTLRLLPVLLVAGLVAMAIGWFNMLPDDYENLAESVLATNLFANNILSAVTTGDYWNVANEYKPLMHTWYVGLLMQFYLVYPLLFYLAKFDKKSSGKTLLVIISSLAFLSLLTYFACENDAFRFYYLPLRFYEFAMGGIVALLYDQSRNKPFHPAFSYFCYALLLILLLFNYAMMPDSIRLVMVVALSVVLVMSGDALGNKVASNKAIAMVGVASYSIFVWHQVFLAFYRYIWGNQFTIWTYLILFATVGIVSWTSYQVIEQGVVRAARSEKGRRVVYVTMTSLYLLLTGFAGYIYVNAGVVRDIPELGMSVQNRHRRMNVEYTERGYQYNRPFVASDKPHWLIIGNSFGRDFVNIVLESKIADLVELSFADIDNLQKIENDGRLASADMVFIARRGFSKKLVDEIEVLCWSAGIPPEKVVVVGDKSFGEHNGHVYAQRYRPDYFEQCVEPIGAERFINRNRRFRELYGERFLDMMAMVLNDDGKVRVFTPDHHFISADGKHLTPAGAKYFAERIGWERFLKSTNDDVKEKSE